jgi:hypothetical protein
MCFRRLELLRGSLKGMGRFDCSCCFGGLMAVEPFDLSSLRSGNFILRSLLYDLLFQSSVTVGAQV